MNEKEYLEIMLSLIDADEYEEAIVALIKSYAQHHKLRNYNISEDDILRDLTRIEKFLAQKKNDSDH